MVLNTVQSLEEKEGALLGRRGCGSEHGAESGGGALAVNAESGGEGRSIIQVGGAVAVKRFSSTKQRGQQPWRISKGPSYTPHTPAAIPGGLAVSHCSQ